MPDREDAAFDRRLPRRLLQFRDWSVRARKLGHWSIYVPITRYDQVLVRLRQTFGDRPFTVKQAARELEYWGSNPPPERGAPVVFYGGFASPLPRRSYPASWERGRQHAKADITRLHKMGLLARSPLPRGRPGRRPFLYRLTRKARRYLAWLHGAGILDAFQGFIREGTGAGAISAGEALLRRLQALEEDNFGSSLAGAFELRLSILRYRPSLQAYVDAWQMAAFVCALVVFDSGSLRDQVRAWEVLVPRIRGLYAFHPTQETAGSPIILRGSLSEPKGPASVGFLLHKVPARDPNGTPILNEDGTPRCSDLEIRIPSDEVERVLHLKEPRLELDLTAAGFGKVSIDLASLKTADGRRPNAPSESVQPEAGKDAPGASRSPTDASPPPSDGV